MPWNEPVNCEEVLVQKWKQKRHELRIRKKGLKFIELRTRTEGSHNLTLTIH